MPYKDPEKQREYFRQYDAKRAAVRAATHRANPELRRAKWREYDAKRKGSRTEYSKRRYAANADVFREKSRARYAANPQKEIARHSEWQMKNRKRLLDYNRKRDGLPDPTRPLDGKCECCGALTPDKSRAFNLDHCHDTGKFRGWLCGRCNRGIGLLGDNLEGVMKAVRYLRRAELL